MDFDLFAFNNESIESVFDDWGQFQLIIKRKFIGFEQIFYYRIIIWREVILIVDIISI